VEHFRYHAACGEAATALARPERPWFPPLAQTWAFHPQRSGIACRSCSVPDIIDHTSTSHSGPGRRPVNNLDDDGWLLKTSGPRCVWNYLHRSTLVLVHHPTAKTITTEALVLKSNACHSCGHYMRGPLLKLSVALGGEIQNAVERVSSSKSLVCDVEWYMFLHGRFPYPMPLPCDRVPGSLPIQIDHECGC
jgi:hypothetical protein